MCYVVRVYDKISLRYQQNTQLLHDPLVVWMSDIYFFLGFYTFYILGKQIFPKYLLSLFSESNV